MSIVSTLLSTSHITIPVLLLAFIYHQTFLFWYATVGGGAWAPAWPTGRTRLVLCMVAVPLWALIMLVWMHVLVIARKTLSSRSKSRNEYQLVDSNMRPDPTNNPVDGDEGLQYKRFFFPLRRIGRSWFISFGIYLSLVLVGVFLLATYEYAGDHRYRSKIRVASRTHKSKGYGSGGM